MLRRSSYTRKKSKPPASLEEEDWQLILGIAKKLKRAFRVRGYVPKVQVIMERAREEQAPQKGGRK